MLEAFGFADIERRVKRGQPGVYEIQALSGVRLKVGIADDLRERLLQHRASRQNALMLKPGGDRSKPCPEQLWRIAQRKLDQLNAAVSLHSLRIPPGNELEVLKGDRDGQHSIWINDQFRVCFVWTKDEPERLEITDYH